MRKISFLIIAAGTTIFSAYGQMIPVLSPNPPGLTTGGFTWNYAVDVNPTTNIEHGDFFTIYDFGTFVPGSNVQPTGWTFSSALTGVTPSPMPPTVIPVDNPSIANLTWTYTGTTPINGTPGDFSVIAITNQLRNSDFGSEATLNQGSRVGEKARNVGPISVPIPEMSALVPILSVCAAGIVAAIPSFLRRRKIR
jgi:hypothetical protein